MRKIVIVSMLMLAGCATKLSPEAAKLQMANEVMVKDCIFLGPIDGTSGIGGMASSVGINNARNEVLETANALGATHIVTKSASGGWGSSFLADAYRCPEQS